MLDPPWLHFFHSKYCAKVHIWDFFAGLSGRTRESGEPVLWFSPDVISYMKKEQHGSTSIWAICQIQLLSNGNLIACTSQGNIFRKQAAEVLLPQMVVNPSEIEQVVAHGGQAEAEITVSNVGTADLTFNIAC